MQRSSFELNPDWARKSKGASTHSPFAGRHARRWEGSRRAPPRWPPLRATAHEAHDRSMQQNDNAGALCMLHHSGSHSAFPAGANKAPLPNSDASFVSPAGLTPSRGLQPMVQWQKAVTLECSSCLHPPELCTPKYSSSKPMRLRVGTSALPAMPAAGAPGDDMETARRLIC